jgi:hypothetical protein
MVKGTVRDLIRVFAPPVTRGPRCSSVARGSSSVLGVADFPFIDLPRQTPLRAGARALAKSTPWPGQHITPRAAFDAPNIAIDEVGSARTQVPCKGDHCENK